ncbi:MAG: single-stranded DNA-binding protein [Chloroflexi bacterium]|nr:MAG: single-stranded DNA-binding protein [Chloroflexota bacterium]
MVNRVTLIGNLTRDAESIAARSPMTRMRLATNSVWRDANGNRQEQAEYHTVISFGRLAEICAAYCVKGRRIFVEGKLRYREYDASDGQRKVATEIVADVVRLLDRREGAGEHDADDREAEAPAVEPALATA